VDCWEYAASKFENLGRILFLDKLTTFFDKVGGVEWEARSATCVWGSNLAFAIGPRKTTENLDRAGRSQDLSDAQGLLTKQFALQIHESQLQTYD
jgi:hypothetical protein